MPRLSLIFFLVNIGRIVLADAPFPSPSPSKTVDCDQVCGSFVSVDSNINSSYLNLSGDGEWSRTDDQYCANHGVVTDPSVLASTEGCVGVSDSSCSVPFCKDSENCSTAEKKLQHCGLKSNSIAQSQCLSYETAKAASTYNTVALSFNIAAVASCTTACFVQSTGFGAVITAFCTAADLVASGVEFAATTKLEGDSTAKMVSQLLAGVGAVSGGLSGYKGYKNYQEGKSSGGEKKGSVSEKEPLLDSNDPTSDAYDHTDDLVKTDDASKVTDKVDDAAETLEGKAKGKSKVKNKEACITAFLYAALTGIRGYHIAKTDDLKRSSCQEVQKLVSNFKLPPPLNSGSGGGGTGGNRSSSGTQMGSTSGASSSGIGVPLTKGCESDSSQVCLNMPASSAATALDTGAITQKKVVEALLPMASQVASNLASQGSSNVGKAIQDALGGGGGSFGGELASYASKIQADPSSALSALPQMAPLSSGGAILSSKRSSGSSIPSFDFSLGEKKATETAAIKELTFGTLDLDIWHAKSTQNLFQIVSTRIEKASVRLR